VIRFENAHAPVKNVMAEALADLANMAAMREIEEQSTERNFSETISSKV
jgi:hypothetical protein